MGGRQGSTGRFRNAFGHEGVGKPDDCPGLEFRFNIISIGFLLEILH